MKTLKRRSVHTLALAALCTFALGAPDAQARTEMGNQETPGKRMPVGDYLCGVGSYKPRPCKVIEEDGAFFLVIPDGIGHFLPMRARLLGTDEADQLILSARATNADPICPSCPDAEMGKPGSSCQEPLEAKKVCVDQTMTAIINKKGKVWRGELPYFIIRGNYKRVGDKFKLQSWYRHGVTQKIVIRKK